MKALKRASWLGSLRGKMKELNLDLVLPIFVLNLTLNFSHFFPDLREINVWDEANYLHNGYLLLTRGRLTDLAGSPLSSILYALTTLPVLNSPNFFVLSDAIGRFFLFTLIFFSIYLISQELKPYANPWVMIGMILIVPIASTMYLFPSDVLFAGLSGLAFWQMLAFYHRRAKIHLWWASAFMGLAALARAEGLILIGVMLVVVFVIVLPHKKWHQFISAILVPFIGLVGGYILFYGLTTGSFATGLPERTFNNFESGHEVIYSQTGIFTPTISARLESREVFGTPEENDFSIFRAIRRNPRVYFQRLKAVVPEFIGFAVKAYGNKFLLVILWLSIRGAISLFQKKDFPLLLLCVLWFAPWGVGFLNTFFREGYFKMPFFVLFSLTSIGITAIIENLSSRREQLGLILGVVLTLSVSLLFKNTSMIYRNTLFVFGLGLIYLLMRRVKNADRWQTNAYWLLLVLALVIRGSYPSPELPQYGRSDLEKSVYFLQDLIPSGSKVLAGAPAMVWAARMEYAGINSYDIPRFVDEAEFLTWIQVQDIKAIYVDQHFPTIFQEFVLALAEEGLSEVYATPERDLRIFLVD